MSPFPRLLKGHTISIVGSKNSTGTLKKISMMPFGLLPNTRYPSSACLRIERGPYAGRTVAEFVVQILAKYFVPIFKFTPEILTGMAERDAVQYGASTTVGSIQQPPFVDVLGRKPFKCCGSKFEYKISSQSELWKTLLLETETFEGREKVSSAGMVTRPGKILAKGKRPVYRQSKRRPIQTSYSGFGHKNWRKSGTHLLMLAVTSKEPSITHERLYEIIGGYLRHEKPSRGVTGVYLQNASRGSIASRERDIEFCEKHEVYNYIVGAYG
jgi:hypothetical protein